MTYDWKKVARAIQDMDLDLHGNRVGILGDEAEDTFGNTTIVRPESHKTAPLSGTIVALGMGIEEKDIENRHLTIGRKLNFNKFNVISFELALDGFSKPVVIDVLHIDDIYWGSGQ